MRRTRWSAVAFGLLLAGCRDEPTAAEEREELVGALADDLVAASDGALDEEAARCVAERLADDVGVERFDELERAEAGDADETLRDQVVSAFEACDALDPLRDGG